MSANSVCANCVIPWHRQLKADTRVQGRDADKAQGYIAALDNARSEDKWSDVPELIRKVTKHAPHRKCMFTFNGCRLVSANE